MNAYIKKMQLFSLKFTVTSKVIEGHIRSLLCLKVNFLFYFFFVLNKSYQDLYVFLCYNDVIFNEMKHGLNVH